MEGARGNGKKFVDQREIFKFLEGGLLLDRDERLAKSRDA